MTILSHNFTNSFQFFMQLIFYCLLFKFIKKDSDNNNNCIELELAFYLDDGTEFSDYFKDVEVEFCEYIQRGVLMCLTNRRKFV